MEVKKKLQLTSFMVLALFVMSACTASGTTSEITAESTDFWSKFVYFFAEIIRFLSFDTSIGLGIIYPSNQNHSFTSLSDTNGGI